MKKHYLLLLFAGLAIGSLAQPQDYIITWQNDTLVCKLPGDLKKTGLKPVWKYDDGYEKVVTVFENDSIRIIKAGEIKGYHRKDHGKGLLCDGVFEAKQIVTTGQNKRTLVEENRTGNNLPWYFLSRVIEGKYANLYIRYVSDGRDIFAAYYLHRHGIEEENTVLPFFNKKKTIEVLSDGDIANEMKAFKYKKSNKGFAEIVNEYNRLKEAVTNKKSL